MRSCEQMQERISCMIDNELSETELSELKAHIAGCPECRRLYEAFFAVSAELSELEEMQESVAPKVMEAIRPKRKSQWRRVLPLAACFAVAIFFGVRTGLPADSVEDSSVEPSYQVQDKAQSDAEDKADKEDKTAYDSAAVPDGGADIIGSTREDATENKTFDDDDVDDSVTEPDWSDWSDVPCWPGSPDAPDAPNNSLSGAEPDTVFAIDDADDIAALTALLGKTSGATVPESAECDCTLLVSGDDGETRLHIYYDGDSVYVSSDTEILAAACSAQEMRDFISTLGEAE